MRSLYYKVCPSGYQKTYLSPPPNINHEKRLPVYRVVNEFMNLDDDDRQEPVREQAQQSKFYVNIEHSSQALGDTAQPQVKFISRKGPETSERDQVVSNYTQASMIDSKGAIDKQRSERDLKSSVIGTVIKANTRSNFVDGKSDKITAVDHGGNQRLMEFELEKERALRKNLEKSYENLLKTLREKEEKLNFQEEQFPKKHRKTTTKRSQTDRYNKIDEDFDANEIEEMKKSQKMRKSCCHFQESSESENNEEELAMYPQFRDEEQFQSYFMAEKSFQNSLLDRILALRLRIQKIDSHLIEQEHLFKQDQQKLSTLQRQNSNLKQELHYQKLLSQRKDTSKVPESGLSKKQHFHYIFTIMIMFLCFAMFIKHKQ